MSTLSNIQKYLASRKTGATVSEITKAIKGNANTVRKILGAMVSGKADVSGYISKERRKCKVSGKQVLTYSL